MTRSRPLRASPMAVAPPWVAAALAESGVPSAVIDLAGQIRWSNPSFNSLLGLADLVLGPPVLGRRTAGQRHAQAWSTTLFSLEPTSAVPTLRRAVHEVVGRREPAVTLHHLLLTAGPRHLAVDVTVSYLGQARDGGDDALGLVQLVDRSSEYASLSTTRALSENALDVVVLATQSGCITWASASVSAVLGLQPHDLVQRQLAELLPAEDAPLLGRLLRIGTDADPTSRATLRLRSATGAFRSMSVSARTHAQSGESIVALGMRDVTDELRAKRELARSEEQFRMALLGAPDGMAVADGHDRIVQVNPALCELLGRQASALIGHRFREFIPVEQRDKVDQWRDRLLLGPASIERLQHPMTTPTGDVWVDHSVGVMRDDTGSPTHFVHQFADRTAHRMIQADLAYRASHDSHTGLANRASLMARLGQRLGAPVRSSDVVGVLFADIDNLKPINDRFGHPVGDTVIATIALRLQAAVRRHDVVARVGGDEFAIVLEHCSTIPELEVVARNVQQAASGPVQTASGPVEVTITVGAVLASSSAETDLTLARVDEALYAAKRGGRNRVAVSTVLVEG